MTDAAHAEYGEGGTPVITMLECSINGSDIELKPTPASKLAGLYENQSAVTEHTTCNYGLSLSVEHIASSGGMAVAGIDALKEIRAIERPGHPFFVATLYQPQLRSTAENPHPVFLGLVRAALARS